MSNKYTYNFYNHCAITGYPKNIPIEFYLQNKLIGETLISQGSMSCSRIAAAKAIGIEYYDSFIIRPKNNGFTADSRSCIINGKELNDFDKPFYKIANEN